MIITYYIDDGNASSKGNLRFVDIPDEELIGLAEDETLEDYIDEVVKEDFWENVRPAWDREQIKHLL
jgi:hypothetical protein